jgi:prolipoprotein diacylglyceryltransferase
MTSKALLSDCWVRPRIRVLGQSWSAFLVWGYTALGLALVLTTTLSIYLGRSPLMMVMIAAVAVVTILSLAMAIKIVTGEEQLVHYHHAISIVAVTSLLLWFSAEPVLPYLDLTVLGIGMFLAAGRVGCFMVGCCHGRPCRWGVRYRDEHAEAGFPRCYVGVRLFPVQLLESVWVLFIVGICGLLLLSGHPPGTCLGSYVVGYGAGRFLMEFMRGDAERPYLWGFSEPQWTSLGLMCLLSVLELAGGLPFEIWHFAVTASVLLAMLGIALKRRLQPNTAHQLLSPPHVGELAEALGLVTDQRSRMGASLRWSRTSKPRQVQIACTSLGVQVSASIIDTLTNRTYHYALSQRDSDMTEETARRLSRLILKLRSASGPSEFLAGHQGVFHLLITTQEGASVVHS